MVEAFNEEHVLNSSGQPETLSERISAHLRSQGDYKEVLKNEEHLIHDLYQEYYKVMKEQLEVLLELVEEHRLKSQHSFADRTLQRLVQVVATQDEELRCLKTSIRKETYTEETLPALGLIRTATEKQISALQDAHSHAVARIDEYNSQPTDFVKLAQEYGDILAKIENQEVLNEELKRDLSVSLFSGLDRRSSQEW